MAKKWLSNLMRRRAKVRKPIRNAGVALAAEQLEDRAVPAIFTVTFDGVNPPPVGQPKVSLADAINMANANPGADQINFSSAITNVLVDKTMLLPTITDTVVIDGTGGNGKITIHFNSADATDVVNGFTVTAQNTIIRNLIMMDDKGPNNFNPIGKEYGIKITGAGGFNLQNVSIGNTAGQSFDGDAVVIINSPNNIIGGAGSNQSVLIFSNNGNGVHISGAASTNNLVQQATIEKNAGDGILIDTGASGNIIGGFTSSPVNSGNKIDGNTGNGVHLNNSSNNRIQRNFIGNDGTNDPTKANGSNGILIENGSAFNIIGGNDLTAGNKISGNTENGIYIRDQTSASNQIQSNLIGLDPNVTNTAMPNSGNGILVEGAANTFVGSTTTAANYISGNNLNGVRITGATATGTIVVNNRIGLGGTSLTTLDTKVGNVQDGIAIDGATGITIGGAGTNAQNIIGANRHGVAIFNGSSNITVKGNWLGLNRLPNLQYPNSGNLQDGIFVQNSTGIQIGGVQSLEGNKIASNRNGIHVVNSGNVTMQGNYIGTNLTGTIIPLPVGLVENFQPPFQAEDGILVEGSTNIKIGTPAQNGGNLMSHNRHGISIINGSSNVTIQNNRIGTQSTSPPSITTDDLGNQDDGIFIDASSNVLIGGTGPANGNLVARNLDGIQVSGGSTLVTIQGNTIRNNSQSGIRIEDSSFVTVGGSTTGAKNAIFNRRTLVDFVFQLDGIFIVSGSHDNVIQGNWIGTDSTGDTTLGNRGNGVLIDGSSNNIVGMTTAAGTPAQDIAAQKVEGNIIVNNSFNGIAVVESTGPATGNKLSGNITFNNGLLGIDLGSTIGDVTLNDVGDVDTGANNLQNFPVINFAQSTATTGTVIQGILNAAPNRAYRIEFFHVQFPNATGTLPNYGQAKDYVGSTTVLTDGSGNATFSFTNSTALFAANDFVTGTATDLVTGDTSELGLDHAIEGAPGPNTYVVNNDGGYFLTVAAPNPVILIPPNGNMTFAMAVQLANEHPGDDRIVFALPPEFTITPSGGVNYFQESRWVLLNGDVPDITDTLIIDGSHLAWPQIQGGTKNFDLDYTIFFNNGTHGLVVNDLPSAQSQFSNPNATADLVVVRHLTVSGSGAPGIGIALDSKFGGANIQDVRINGFGSDGVQIFQSPNNIVGGSGANQAVNINAVAGTGVNIIGAQSTNNLVQQTNIGTGVGGAGGNGIWIQGANNNTIGGFVGGTGVSIRASGANGVYVVNSSGTRIQRSTIGDPTNLFPNHFDGVRIENSPLTLIGGVTADAGNNISGNTENGINIFGINSAGAQIQSNIVGTQVAPNSGDGILIDNVANVAIGSTVTAANAVTGNNLNGIELRGAGSQGAKIINTSSNNNLLDGILIDGVPSVTIGGPLAAAGGTVSKNRKGINIMPGSSQINIQQYNVNFNAEEGILVDSSSNLLIGGTGSAVIGNQVSGNRDGIRLLNSTQVALQGNFIGTDRGGTTIAGFGQSEDGVIIDGSNNVSVGAPFQFGDNVISGNRNGVRVINGSANFTIQNNEIGSNRAGTAQLGNTDDGIRLDGITGATVGGTLTLSGNFVSGNRNGLHLAQGTTLTTVLGNTFANSRESGVLLEGSSNNQIGGQTAAERNIISSNTINGVYFKPDFTVNPFSPIVSDNNKVQGNFIGVGFNGTGNFGNGNAGIYIDGGTNNLIGGTVHDIKLKLEQGNIIANSGTNGVSVVTDNGLAFGNTIRGNSIFGNGLLAIDLNGNIGLVDDNDPLDTDGGANDSVNYPEIVAAQAGSVGTMVQAKLDAAPSTNYHIEFFGNDISNPTGVPNGFGQGKVFLGSTDVTTDGFGNADNITFSTLTPLASGWWVSATATDSSGNTSEMGKAVQSTDATGLVSGIKFNDLNGNGIQDLNEPGLSGWEIDLDYNNDGTIDLKAFTDAGGNYSFPRLIDGVYSIAEVQKLGWIQTHAPVPNPVQITAGSAVTDVDFGNFKLIKISGNKFEDLNGNGLKDAGEGPLSGVFIDLYGYDAKTGAKLLLGETATDLSGNYAFTNVGPGGPGSKGTPANGIYTKWEVYEKVPTGYTQTAPATGFYTISVVSGTDVTNLNFGNKKGGGGPGGGGTGAQIVAGSGSGSTPLAVAFDNKGIQMFSIVPYAVTFKGGVRVAKGDVTGDNVNDIITAPGAGMAPQVNIYDGTTGKLVRSFNAFDAAWKGGVFVATADINHDGTQDIIVGADATGSPEVRVYDGLTGIQLFQFLAYSPFFRGGVRVAGGDVNGDGFADIITSPGAGMAPTVRVFDGSSFGTGQTPAMLRQFNAYEPSFTKGVYVSTGNFNGDAFADIVTGPEAGHLPNVRVWDGIDGHMIKDLLANSTGFLLPPSQISTDQFNSSGMRVSTADIDGDGLSDVITGPGVLKGPRVRVYSSASWAKILDFAAMPASFLGGVYVG